MYGNSQKAERKFGVIVSDSFYESTSTDLVDLAIGMGARYLNIKGINRTEKLNKVLRYNQITKKLFSKLPKETKPVEELAHE